MWQSADLAGRLVEVIAEMLWSIEASDPWELAEEAGRPEHWQAVLAGALRELPEEERQQVRTALEKITATRTGQCRAFMAGVPAAIGLADSTRA
ncbi:hypothetical protein [Actinoallomurus rhizosphaericola]|uniref:hypothetical protein n=1 Tax=Actinoallomurus rhizosphaericola TaxID=2952536 RepID=UPI0020907AD3|nr:hypothetical protein [Actinoallomurus rhizosphaericola]MCO5994623.1 hypothetical protein [Actinoallomurus rhizosphaericola]